MTDTARYRRILLKLSGEALLGEQDYGIDPDDLEAVIRRGVLVYGHDFEQVMNRLVPNLRDAG